MFHSVFMLLYFLTQTMDTAYKVNDIKHMHLEVELAMSLSVTDTA